MSAWKHSPCSYHLIISDDCWPEQNSQLNADLLRTENDILPQLNLLNQPDLW